MQIPATITPTTISQVMIRAHPIRLVRLTLSPHRHRQQPKAKQINNNNNNSKMLANENFPQIKTRQCRLLHRIEIALAMSRSRTTRCQATMTKSRTICG